MALRSMLRPRTLLNPVSRVALATFAWKHRHEILRWGRSLYEQLIGQPRRVTGPCGADRAGVDGDRLGRGVAQRSRTAARLVARRRRRPRCRSALVGTAEADRSSQASERDSVGCGQRDHRRQLARRGAHVRSGVTSTRHRGSGGRVAVGARERVGDHLELVSELRNVIVDHTGDDAPGRCGSSHGPSSPEGRGSRAKRPRGGPA